MWTRPILTAEHTTPLTVIVSLFGCCAIFVMIGFTGQMQTWRCSATTSGALFDDYTFVRERSNSGIWVRTSYKVGYSYSVDGRAFQGKDSLSEKPIRSETTVYYNPSNPADSLVEPKPYALPHLLLIFVLGAAGSLVLVFYIMRLLS